MRFDALWAGDPKPAGLAGCTEWLLEELRECAGGVGGRSGPPLRRDREGGLESWELEGDQDDVESAGRSGGASVLVYATDDLLALGCGRFLCLRRALCAVEFRVVDELSNAGGSK